MSKVSKTAIYKNKCKTNLYIEAKNIVKWRCFVHGLIQYMLNVSKSRTGDRIMDSKCNERGIHLVCLVLNGVK